MTSIFGIGLTGKNLELHVGRYKRNEEELDAQIEKLMKEKAALQSKKNELIGYISTINDVINDSKTSVTQLTPQQIFERLSRNIPQYILRKDFDWDLIEWAFAQRSSGKYVHPSILKTEHGNFYTFCFDCYNYSTLFDKQGTRLFRCSCFLCECGKHYVHSETRDPYCKWCVKAVIDCSVCNNPYDVETERYWQCRECGQMAFVSGKICCPNCKPHRGLHRTDCTPRDLLLKEFQVKNSE